jgi:flagellar capping protein FliD
VAPVARPGPPQQEEVLLSTPRHEVNEEARDKISEDPELTAWRRSLRGKFNTKEGAELARANSLLMAEKRAEERLRRKGHSDGTTATPTGAAGAAAAAAPAAAAGAAEAAAAPAASAGDEGDGAKPQ